MAGSPWLIGRTTVICTVTVVEWSDPRKLPSSLIHRIPLQSNGVLAMEWHIKAKE